MTNSDSSIDVSTGSLKTGDILLRGERVLSSRAISEVTESPFSHAAMYDGAGNLIEAVADSEGCDAKKTKKKGCVKSTPLNKFMEHASELAIYRRKDLSADEARTAVENARLQMDKEYDFVGAAQTGARYPRAAVILGVARVTPGVRTLTTAADAAFLLRGDTNKTFCSKLVADSYQQAGVPIVEQGIGDPAPAAIAESPKVQYVGHLISPRK